MKQLACTLIVGLTLALPAGAQEADPSVPLPGDGAASAKQDRQDRRDESAGLASERRDARLDLMFGRLAQAENKRGADRIARNIMRQLVRSGSPTADFLMERAGAAMREKKLSEALDFLDGVVRTNPDFAEGWNRRATVHFMRGDYGRSLADIEQVLRLEPRHWGALAGLSIILASLEKNREAVEVMDRALAIHPHLEEVKERRDKLMQQIEGSDI
jgi:tetratricopeptide (TPR) repeat protein